jgi:hypothetical protein
MNLRTTFILFGVLVAGLGVFLALQLLGVGTTEERDEASKYLLASLNQPGAKVTPADIETLTVERQDAKKPEQKEKWVFRREGKSWKLLEPRPLRVSESAVDNLVRQVIELQREKLDVSRQPLAELGLEQPSMTITLTKGGKSATLKIGKQGLGGTDPNYYAVSSDAPQRPAVIRKSRAQALWSPLNDLREKRLLTSSFGAKQVKLTGTARTPLELEKTSETSWVFKEPALGDADLSAATGFATELAAAAVERNEDFIYDGTLDEATLNKYGLAPDKAAFVLSLTQTAVGNDKQLITETLYVGAKDMQTAQVQGQAATAIRLVAGCLLSSPDLLLLPAAASALGDQAREESQKHAGYYARRLGEDAVVRLPARFITILERKADEFRVKALAKLDVPKVDAVNLTAAGETLRFRRLVMKADGTSPSEWDLFTDSRARVKAHPGTVQKLLDALNKLAVKDSKAFLDDDARQRAWFGTEPIDLGFDKPQAEIVVWQEGLPRDAEGKATGDGEPKLKDEVKAKPALKLSVGRADAKRGVVYVKREVAGAPTTILAIADPWRAAPPPSLPGQPSPPPASGEEISLSGLTSGGYLAYRDHLLPSFRPDLAAKLSLFRGSEVYELVKEEKKDDTGATKASWILQKPVAGVSPNAESLLAGLVGLGADKLVTDRPTERDLEEKFGLGGKALLRIQAVTKPDDQQKTSDFTWFIGKRTDADSKHPGHHYVRLVANLADGSKPEANDFVFLLDAGLVQALDQELRNTQIFSPENARIITASFTWRSVDAAKKPAETRLELALGNDKKTWEVKTLTLNGADAKASLPKLDQARVEALLGGSDPQRTPMLPGVPRLFNLYTERFVIHNGPPTPEQHLDPAKADAPPPLTVELKLEGGQERKLVVGAQVEIKAPEQLGVFGRTFYFATASTVPNAVFLLSEADFKPLLAGPDFFKGPATTAAK